MDMQNIQNFLSTTITELAIKVLAAIAFWIVGRWLIGMVSFERLFKFLSIPYS